MNYCTVCTYKYDEYDHIPLCMPCGHSYCNMCIERECVGLVLFICPQCRHEISMVQVRNAPKNLALLSVLQQQQNQTIITQQGFWESIFSQANKTYQTTSQLQTMEESGMMQKEILKCILCDQERYMFDGLQSVFCSYNCFTKWRTNS